MKKLTVFLMMFFILLQVGCGSNSSKRSTSGANPQVIEFNSDTDLLALPANSVFLSKDARTDDQLFYLTISANAIDLQSATLRSAVFDIIFSPEHVAYEGYEAGDIFVPAAANYELAFQIDPLTGNPAYSINQDGTATFRQDSAGAFMGGVLSIGIARIETAAQPATSTGTLITLIFRKKVSGVSSRLDFGPVTARNKLRVATTPTDSLSLDSVTWYGGDILLP